MKIYLHQRVWDKFKYESSIIGLKETGGILIGYRVKNEFIITAATGPGPKAKHYLFNFQRDVEFCNDILLKKFEESKGIILI
jgi:hypothetical protein